MDIKCFLLEPNGMEYRYLQRFTFTDPKNVCTFTGNYGSHNHMIALPDGPAQQGWNLDKANLINQPWPTHFGCGYSFTETNQKQLFTENQYISKDKPGQIFTLRKTPAGAIWRVTWYEDIKGGAVLMADRMPVKRRAVPG